jgi:hypothetical protein
MAEIQMTKTRKPLETYQPYLARFEALEHWNLGFVSDFGIQISNLATETHTGHGSKVPLTTTSRP